MPYFSGRFQYLEETGAAAQSGSCRVTIEQEPVLHWFFFPLRAAPEAKAPADLVAWESTSRSGRATYFFRILLQDQAGQLLDPTRAPAALESAIQRLNRALILLNFKREPIYLSDESFETQAMSVHIVEERRRSRCPPAAAPRWAAARRPAAKCQVILARALRRGLSPIFPVMTNKQYEEDNSGQGR